VGGMSLLRCCKCTIPIITVGSDNFNLVKILHILYTNQSINSRRRKKEKKKLFWVYYLKLRVLTTHR